MPRTIQKKSTTLALPALSFPWAEFLEDGGTETSSWRSQGTQAATFRMEIPGTWFDNHNGKWDQVRGELLGYSRKGAGDKIIRVTPFPHPRTPQLYCEEIADTKPLGYRGQHSKGKGYSLCERVVLTLRFASRPYQILTDTENKSFTEENRYVEQRPAVPRTNLIVIKGAYMWKDAAAGSLNNQPVDASLGIRHTISKYVLVWHQVPERYVLDSTGFPTKIALCVGKVNSGVFLGQPAETLLCEAPDIVPEEAPVPTLIGGGPVGRNSRRSPYYMCVTLNFLHSRPTTTSTVAAGWNVHPTPSNQWFRILAAKAATPSTYDTLQYEQADFANLWQAAP